MAFERVATPEALFAVPSSYGAPGVPVARIPTIRRPGTDDPDALVEDHLEALRAFVRQLAGAWRPDVIHAHTGLPDGVAAATVGRELGIPVVVSEHASTVDADLASPVARRHYRGLFEPGMQLVAVSPSLAGRVATATGKPGTAIEILPDPVDDGAFPLANPSRRIPGELLWVGSLGEHKGIDVLLEAFAIVHGSRPATRLRLVGGERTRGERARWDTTAAGLGIAAAVTFDGWLDRAGVAAAMARAAAFVHPSPSETFGVAAAEAILTGLPVAARPSGGVPWIVELSGGFGSVAEGDGAPALATAIELVLDGAFPVDAATARARLVETVGEAAVARQAIDLYRALQADSAPPARPAIDAPARGGRPAGPLPRLVLATGRIQGRRMVEALPDGLRAGLVLVVPAATSEADEPDIASMPGLRVVEADPVPPPRPRPRGRGPLARLRRTVFRPAATADDQLAAALDKAAGADASTPGPVDVVAIDAPAVTFLARRGGTRYRLAPGSLRWLADRWDAEGRGPG
jgi:glycosyltransferase involved in cell wall biosynthesis